MKKGFTLIELLAVIVILAIIATIATPIVLNIIKDTKKSANIRSAENYIHSLELSLANNQLTSSNLSDGFYSIDEIEVNVDGKKPTQGYVQIEKGNVVKYDIKIDSQDVDSVKDYNIWDGSKTLVNEQDGVYHITLASELAWVAQVVNDGTNSFEGKLISLEANLDLNNIEWIPIGSHDNSDEYRFKGSFNGNGYIIKNMKIDREGSIYCGLFGDTLKNSNSYLKNIIIKNSNVNCNSILSSIFLGDARSSVIVENIIGYNNSITATMQDDSEAGIIVGHGATGSIVKKCISINNTIIGNNYVGGVAGTLRGDTSNLKSINNIITGKEYVGGIASYLFGNSIYEYSNLTSINNMIKGQKFIGGISGFIDTTKAQKLISNNNSIYGQSIVGGITGNVQNNSELKDSSSSSNLYSDYTSQVKYIGGISGVIQNSKIHSVSSSGIIDIPIATEVGGIVGLVGYDSTNINFSEIEGLTSNIKINALSNIGTIIGRVSRNVTLDASNITLEINGNDSNISIGATDDPSYVSYE